MAKDVNAALVDVLDKYLSSNLKGSSSSSPGELLQSIKEEGRYLVDAWS